jgi:hypothetical protein
MKKLLLFLFLLPISIIAQTELIIQGDVVNIRKVPNVQGEVVAKAKRFERLTVLQHASQDLIGGVTDYWYRVQTSAGKVGYVFGSFTSLKLEGQRTEDLYFTEISFGDCFHVIFGDHDFGMARNSFGVYSDLIDEYDSGIPKYVGKKFRVTYNELFTMASEACNPELPEELVKTETIVNLILLN